MTASESSLELEARLQKSYHYPGATHTGRSALKLSSHESGQPISGAILLSVKTKVLRSAARLALLHVALVGAQTADLIQAFNSVIGVDRDRTIHVRERLELINGGLFDGGVHRRLRIKPASAERAKAGSFESFSATIDGQEGTVKPVQIGDNVDAVIATNTGSLGRGKHVIELAYTAKHQFDVYDYFEDFNQNITGEWPVPTEKARSTFRMGFLLKLVSAPLRF